MTGYYLIDNPNPNASERGDGRYWGYATMNYAPTCIVLHTAESVADLIGDDLGAENVARWFSTNNVAASYHTLVDSDSTVRCLPAGLGRTTVHTAFHASGVNSWTLGLSLAMRADSWPTVPEGWATKILNRAVNEAALWCMRWDIPPMRVPSFGHAMDGVKGFLAHADTSPTDRSDPGTAFPWERFLALLAAQLELGPSTTPEDDMTPEQATQLAEVRRDIIDDHLAGRIVSQLDVRLNALAARLDAIDQRLGAIEAGEMPTPDELVVAAARRIALGAP